MDETCSTKDITKINRNSACFTLVLKSISWWWGGKVWKVCGETYAISFRLSAKKNSLSHECIARKFSEIFKFHRSNRSFLRFIQFFLSLMVLNVLNVLNKLIEHRIILSRFLAGVRCPWETSIRPPLKETSQRSWRRLEDMSWIRPEDIFKTFWRQKMVIPVSRKSKCVCI